MSLASAIAAAARGCRLPTWTVGAAMPVTDSLALTLLRDAKTERLALEEQVQTLTRELQVTRERLNQVRIAFEASEARADELAQALARLKAMRARQRPKRKRPRR